MKKAMSLLLAASLAVSSLSALAYTGVDAISADSTLTVTASTLRVRKGPSTEYGVETRVHEGDILSVLEVDGNWFKVETEDGSVGYVYKTYVAMNGNLADDDDDIADEDIPGEDVDIPDEEIPDEEENVTDDGTQDDILLPDGDVEFEATLVRADGWNDFETFEPQDFVYAGHMDKDNFLDGHTAEEFPEAFEQIAKYDEEYFANSYKTLLVFNIVAPSGSNTYSVDDMYRKDDTLYIVIDETAPEAGTDDMAEWLCFVEIPNIEYNGEPVVVLNADDAANAAKTFSLELDANATTGYEWSYEIEDDSLLKVVKDEYKADPADEGMAGVGGTQYYVFEGVKAGETDVTFRYARSWEDSEKPMDERTYRVTVDEDLNVTAVLITAEGDVEA